MLKKDNHEALIELEKMGDKIPKLTGKLSSLSLFMNKLENEKKSQIQEKDRLIHKIQQLELDLRNQMDFGTEIANQNSEYCRSINLQKVKR